MATYYPEALGPPTKPTNVHVIPPNNLFPYQLQVINTAIAGPPRVVELAHPEDATFAAMLWLSRGCTVQFNAALVDYFRDMMNDRNGASRELLGVVTRAVRRTEADTGHAEYHFCNEAHPGVDECPG